MSDFMADTKWIFKPITVDTLVISQACYVKHVGITATSGGGTLVRVYDGLDAEGIQTITISSNRDESFAVNYDIPVYFETGIYIAVFGNIRLFRIQYKIEV